MRIPRTTTWPLAHLVVQETLRAFLRNRGLEKAATLAYYSFFALIPTLLLLVMLGSILLASSQSAIEAVERVARQMAPLSADVIVREVRALAGQKAWGLAGLLVLLGSITPLAAAIRSAWAVIFRAERPWGFLESKLRDGLAILILLVLLLALLAGETLSGLDWRGQWPGAAPLLRGLAWLLRIGLVPLAFLLLYAALCPVRLGPGILLGGALLTTLLLGLLGPVFGWVLRFNPDYGRTFGSLKAVFLLFVWVYYSFAALLLAAEGMAAMHRREALLMKTLFVPASRRKPAPTAYGRHLCSYPPGTRVFSEGDPGTHMFCILEGSVQLDHAGGVLRTMRAGDYFGEMAMLLGSPRTAGATTGPDGATLVTVSGATLDMVLRDNPDVVMHVLKEMAARLKATSRGTEGAAPPPQTGV